MDISQIILNTTLIIILIILLVVIQHKMTELKLYMTDCKDEVYYQFKNNILV